MRVVNKTFFPLIFLSLLWLLLPQADILAWAQKKQPPSFDPPRRDRPKGTASGGSRPISQACLASNSGSTNELQALVPNNRIGLSTNERPDFVVYLPQTIAQKGEFSLFDENRNGVYQVDVPVTGRTGVVTIDLQNNAPSLIKNKPYYWTFALVCNKNDRTQDWVVGGWVKYKRVNSNLQQQLNQNTGVQKVSLLAEHDYWYDALAELLKIAPVKENNLILSTTWKKLLQTVGLQDIAKQPISDLREISIKSPQKL
jgi:Domain of Unknown Function (DUF928)